MSFRYRPIFLGCKLTVGCERLCVFHARVVALVLNCAGGEEEYPASEPEPEVVRPTRQSTRVRSASMSVVGSGGRKR